MRGSSRSSDLSKIWAITLQRKER
uniref:Uncharacterized protein n=1 Tax=Anguilla anguilla TaxID=7936 RepID=A0A0E9RK43_ANGAN